MPKFKTNVFGGRYSGFRLDKTVVVAPTAPNTWNPSDKAANITLSGGNLIASNAVAAYATVRAVASKSAGKWYFEATLSGGTQYAVIGVCAAGMSLTDFVGQTTGWSFLSGSGTAQGRTYDNSVSTGDIYTALAPTGYAQVAVDFGASKIWWGTNNAWFAGGNPAAGTGAQYSDIAGTLFPAVSIYAASAGISLTANFGATAFSGTIPAGFSPWD